ncbi:MAG: tRNA (5-methylaminomethyl-2-thiouridine)(34)-methyltransferase MnmD [Lentimicrobium sp.]|nr:tRNA (5-methylaminomethyl-2-thiouridine)(34)-methyltransferase MnmD [Lentimicrobium sp.]
MQEVKLVITEDGSHTLFNESKHENYHSIHGAINESQHVFINRGFNKAAESFASISILEVGFGSGLNALLTLEISIKNQIKVNYTTFEPFPLSHKIVNLLNYTEFDSFKPLKQEFLSMHSANDGSLLQLNKWFIFKKFDRKLQSGLPESSLFNLVYFDAFSPQAEPELWVPEVFKVIRSKMVAGGVFVTYCAKGSVRRALQDAGFNVERLSGPPGKREMLRATATVE